MTEKEELKKRVRIKQLEYQIENAQLSIFEKNDEIQLLGENIEKYKEELNKIKEGE